MNYDERFSAGDIDNGFVNAVIEVPIDTTEKIEWDREALEMRIDRTESTTFPEPTNYGFIPKTIGKDGDALDVLVISGGAIASGMVVKAKILGVMKFVDNGQIDDKIITATINSRYDDLSDLSCYTLDKITYYFSHYKDDIEIVTKVIEWAGIEDAKEVIFDSINAWQKSKE